jgi:hypothetical protein
VLSTARSSSGGSGERRLGLGTISAKGGAGVGPDQVEDLVEEVGK